MVQHPQELPISAHYRRQELVREVVSNWRSGGVQGTTGKSGAGDEERRWKRSDRHKHSPRELLVTTRNARAFSAPASKKVAPWDLESPSQHLTPDQNAYVGNRTAKGHATAWGNSETRLKGDLDLSKAKSVSGGTYFSSLTTES